MLFLVRDSELEIIFFKVSGKGDKSPINFIFVDSSCISSISFLKTSLKRFMRKSTSFVGLVQFSVEKAETVSILEPNFFYALRNSDSLKSGHSTSDI